MRIGLYNIDSKIPNLALMKISAFHKSKGDEVAWCATPIEAMTFDKVYGSQIFTDSKPWTAPNLEMGGSGYDKKKKLPQKIDDIQPDYSIYPDYTDSIGFVTRGCIRKCKFCFVPEMEGGIYEYRDIASIWRGSGNVVLLDNNVLSFSGGVLLGRILRFARAQRIKVDFNQGLDCRLVTPDIASILCLLRNAVYRGLKFAFDDLSYVESVIKTCKLIPGRHHWYVYTDENWESALERCLILKRLNQKPYVMRDKRITKEKKYVVLAHWCNNVVGGFFKHDFWEHYQWYINQGKKHDKK